MYGQALLTWNLADVSSLEIILGIIVNLADVSLLEMCSLSWVLLTINLRPCKCVLVRGVTINFRPCRCVLVREVSSLERYGGSIVLLTLNFADSVSFYVEFSIVYNTSKSVLSLKGNLAVSGVRAGRFDL